MSGKTFRGGIHPDEHKELARNAALTVYEPQGDLVFPVSQHIGKPAKPIVKKGDAVLVGQTIAEADGFVSAPIICSVSGKVKAVEKRLTAGGKAVESIVVENDGKYETVEGFGKETDYTKLTKDEIIEKVRNAGIVGMGGAGFPTSVKLNPKNHDEIKHIIANGSECEPYICCDDQLMRTHAEDIVAGMKVVLSMFPQAEGVVVIEDNKPEAIEAMRKAIAGDDRFRLIQAETKYPQGGERSIIKVVSGIDIKSTMLPADAGCIVDNVGTFNAIYNAVCKNIPLIQRAVTVSGEAIANPSNFLARIGTIQQELVEAAGGYKSEPQKVLSGGPMMGIAMSSVEVPLQKGNNAITALVEDGAVLAIDQMTACIRCGRCNRACPMGLVPQMMQESLKRKDYDAFEKKYYGLECIQCGSCTYVCPAKRPLMQLFKQAKSEVLSRRAKK
ncbi:electron transport complex protein RnfC [Lachnospiraceae bacterium KH1T2]|nr:electron transport complex protein RnfC [Lachnospiraceae bacterium KH1T2]